MKNPNGVFYIDLLAGKYNDSIRRYIQSGNEPIVSSEELMEKLDIRGNQLMSVEEALLESLVEATSSLEKRMEDDTKRILKLFETKIKKYKHLI